MPNATSRQAGQYREYLYEFKYKNGDDPCIQAWGRDAHAAAASVGLRVDWQHRFDVRSAGQTSWISKTEETIRNFRQATTNFRAGD